MLKLFTTNFTINSFKPSSASCISQVSITINLQQKKYLQMSIKALSKSFYVHFSHLNIPIRHQLGWEVKRANSFLLPTVKKNQRASFYPDRITIKLHSNFPFFSISLSRNNDLFISCLMQASFDYTSKYILEIAVRKVANKILGVQLLNRNEIYSLQSTSWQVI